MLKTTSRTTRRTTTIGAAISLPTRVQVACGSWPNLQHVAPHHRRESTTTTTTINSSCSSSSSNTLVIRNMSIYDYIRQQLNYPATKRQRTFSDSTSFPAPKLRKHNFGTYQREREQERDKERSKSGGGGGGAGAGGGKPPLDDYDIRFFFYLNSLILFTMSCSGQYEGEEFKNFICERIRKFDRLRRKARKRRKRRPKHPAELSAS